MPVHAADRLPGRLVEVGVEPRQHHGAVRQVRDRCKQLCGRRHRCGRACRDHRARAVALESRGLRIDQGVASRRGVHQAELGEICWPRLAHNLEKFERGPEMLVHLFRHQRIERRPVDAARDHVILQARQFSGHGEGGGRRIRDQRRLTRALLLRGPGQDQLRQRRLALERVHRARQRQAFCCQRAAGEFRKHDLVLVDIADRDQTRQDRGITAECVEKDHLRQPARAPRRQIERGLSQFHRIARAGKALHQPSRQQGVNQRRKKRHRRGDREQAGGASWHECEII